MTSTVDEGRTQAGSSTVPAPEPPEIPDAWYAAGVREQYEVTPGVVVTIRDTTGDVGFDYQIREPAVGARAERALASVTEYFSAVSVRRPLTRQGAAERAAAGMPRKYRRVIDRLVDLPAAARRRVEYHAMCELRLLGPVTPIALDDRIEVVAGFLWVPAGEVGGATTATLDRTADDALAVLAAEPPAGSGRNRLAAVCRSPESFATERDALERRLETVHPTAVFGRLDTPHGTVGPPQPTGVPVGRATRTVAGCTVTLRVWSV